MGRGLHSLTVFHPGEQVNEKVICNNLFALWWPLRFHPSKRPVYLTFSEVSNLSHSIVSGRDTFETRLEKRAFQYLYQSIIPQTTEIDKWVCFFLHQNYKGLSNPAHDSWVNSNHFFPVLFDYGARTAYAFRVSTYQDIQVKN